jgi:plastocyanin
MMNRRTPEALRQSSRSRLPLASIVRSICASVALLLVVASVEAGERHLVSQKGRRFHPSELSITAGDVVVFQNDDRTDHHIMAVDGPSEFESRLLPRGSSFEVVLDQPGRWEIGCRIHPRMSMIIEVEPVATPASEP